ncbi:MAG TPA: PepSY domain-containing protein [Alphaproteobacteria bacterium]|nr:PepSY domain-containing protein [Alphaproteobacteria bacterium]
MKAGRRGSALLRWHRRIGLVAAALVVILALSGVALNHTTALGLDRQAVTAPWLLEWLGAESKAEMHGYKVGQHQVTVLEDRVFFDGGMIAQRLDGIVGAVETANAIAVAGRTEILLLAENGDLIERISALPTPITGIGVTPDGRLAVAIAPDLVFTADASLLQWQQVRDSRITWTTTSLIPDAIGKQVLQAYGGADVSMERIILEVHSGRIFGSYGPWLMDGAAILLLLLAVTGVIGWSRSRNGNGANDAL